MGSVGGAGLPLWPGAARLASRGLFTWLPLRFLLGALLKLLLLYLPLLLLLLRHLLLARLVLLRALLLARLALLILHGALLSLLRLQRLLLLRLFAQGALAQRGFVLPSLLLLLAGGFRLLALLVAQQALLLALGLRLWVATGVWPGLLGWRGRLVQIAVVLRLFAQCALAQRFFVLPALHADARLLLLLALLLALQALLAVLLLALRVKACSLFRVQRAAVLPRRRGRLRRQGPLAP